MTPAVPVRALTILAVIVLAVAALITAWTRAPLPPAPASVSALDFSAERAASLARPVLQHPRVAGTPDSAAARDVLVTTLESQGWHVDVESGVGVFRPKLIWPDAPSVGGYTENVVATRPGTDPTGTVVLATHYDSVAGSPGAGDDGVGVATLLETGRAIAQDGTSRNDVVILLTDGEEPGMLGAEAFTHAHPQLRPPVTVVNLDARGAGGVPLIVRSAGDVTPLLARMPIKEAESFTETLFASGPGDTDFSRWVDAGWTGVDIVLVGDASVYHSPLDTVDNVDVGSLQTMGEMTLSSARFLAGTDLAELGTVPAGVMTTMPWGVLTLPRPVVVVLSALATVVSGLAVALARRRGELRLRAVLVGGVLSGVALVVTAIAGAAVWPVARALDPGAASIAVGEPPVGLPYLLAEASLAMAVTSTLWWLTRRRPGSSALIHSAVLVMCLGLTLVAAMQASLAVPVVVPAIGSAAALLVGGLLRSPVPRVVAVIALLLPLAYFVGSQLDGAAELGASGSWGFTAVVTMIGLLLGLPVFGAWPSRSAQTSPRDAAQHAFGVSSGRRHRRVGVLRVLACWLLLLGLVAVGRQVNERSGQPRQERVHQVIDADTGTVAWETSGRSEWGRGLAAAPAVAAAANPLGPQVEVITDTTDADRRSLELRVRSQRGAPTVTLDLPAEAGVRRVQLEGRDLTVDGAAAKVVVSGVPAQGANLRLELESAAPVEVVVTDHSPGLPRGGLSGIGQGPPPGWVVTDPRVSVTRALVL